MATNVSFQTKPQHMTFVDHVTHHAVPANQLLAGHLYDVFIVLQNTGDDEAMNVQVNVVHSAFGIGLPGGTSYIIEPAPINIPPANGTDPGLATLTFQFDAPAGGHACLVAKIISNGLRLNQNLDVFEVAISAAAELSFLVYGGPAAETMRLDLSERFTDGTPVPAAQSWSPVLIPPPGISFSGSNPMYLSLAAHGFYSVGLEVDVPATATQDHVFHIEGHVGANYVGECDIVVHAVAACPNPYPYLTGGYQSPDVILYDPTTGFPIPIGAHPGVWDTLLKPNTDYQMAAVVHNASPTPAVNTVVRFWQFPGGVGSAGVLLNVQTVNIPGNGQVTVHSSVPFHSAASFHHSCAVVSIYNSQAPNTPIDAVTANQVPNPDANVAHSPSAWRNTDSTIALAGVPWEILLEVNEILAGPQPPGPGPVEVEVESIFIPKEWEKTPGVLLTETMIREGGAPAGVPLFFHPAMAKTLQHVDMGVQVVVGGKQLMTEKPDAVKKLMAREAEMLTFADGDGMEEDDAGVATMTRRRVKPNMTFSPAVSTSVVEDMKLATEIRTKNNVYVPLPREKGKATPFTVTGTIPKTAKPGDKYVVNVIAHYPPNGKGRWRNITHSQIFFVQEKK